jgi:hypothetical protein
MKFIQIAYEVFHHVFLSENMVKSDLKFLLKTHTVFVHHEIIVVSM